jgi:integrase
MITGRTATLHNSVTQLLPKFYIMPKTETNIELEYNWIKNLKAPDKPVEYSDIKEKGLILRLSKAGTKTFTYRFRSNGKIKRFKIGRFPDVSLSEARKQVQQLRIDVDKGIDPQVEKRKSRYKPKELTFKELSGRFIKNHLSNRKPSTRTEYKRIIKTELLGNYKWGNLPVSEITSQHVREILNKKALDKNRYTMANRIRSTISKLFEYGMTVEGINISVNPVEGTAPFEQGEKVRERFYSADEIIELWDYFEVKREPLQSLLKMLLICGQRVSETMNMKWTDIEFDKPCKKISVGADGRTKPKAFLADVWTIRDNKSNRVHEVPLPPLAIEILEKLKPITGKSEFVFESYRKKGQPITTKTTADSIKKDTSVSDFRVHDLRSTVNTMMEELGIELFTRQKIMNHKGQSVTEKHYSWYNYIDKKQKALNLWNNRLESILSDEEQTAKISKIGS